MQEQPKIVEDPEIKGCKFIAIGNEMAKFGALLLKDKSKKDLKNRVSILDNASKNVNSWFINSKDVSEETKKLIKNELNSSEVYLICEITNVLTYYSEDTLEAILEQLKNPQQ